MSPLPGAGAPAGSRRRDRSAAPTDRLRGHRAGLRRPSLRPSLRPPSPWPRRGRPPTTCRRAPARARPGALRRPRRPAPRRSPRHHLRRPVRARPPVRSPRPMRLLVVVPPIEMTCVATRIASTAITGTARAPSVLLLTWLSLPRDRVLARPAIGCARTPGWGRRDATGGRSNGHERRPGLGSRATEGRNRHSGSERPVVLRSIPLCRSEVHRSPRSQRDARCPGAPPRSMQQAAGGSLPESRLPLAVAGVDLPWGRARSRLAELVDELLDGGSRGVEGGGGSLTGAVCCQDGPRAAGARTSSPP